MRILMLCPYPTIKGPIPKIVPLKISALRSLGCEVVTEDWGRHSDTESFVAKVIGRLGDISRIRQTLHEGFDIILVETAHDWRTLVRDILLLLVTRRSCPRIVLHFHGSFSDRLVTSGYGLFKLASAYLLRLSDAALLLSSEELCQWRQFYPAGKYYLVDNPYLPNHNFRHGTGKLRWSLPSDRPILLFVGKLMASKGIFDLLNAMPLILERIACHLLVAGDGVQAEQVQEFVTKLGLKEHVTLTGYLRGEQLAAAYRIAHALVLPSYWAEGFPTVITEAMDAGLPIITTCIRGTADHLKEGVNALFVPPHDPVSISNAIEILLSDQALYAKMAQTNQEKVKDFAPEIVSKQYLSVFEEIM